MLVTKAFDLLDEKGIEGVGIRQVAREVNVAHSAPANHFKNKQALLTELAKESFDQLLQTLKKQVAGKDTISDSIQAFCASVLEYALRYPNRYSLMWRKDCFDANDTGLNEAMDDVYEVLLAILSNSAREKNVDVESQAIAVWSLIHGYVSLRLDGNLGQGEDAITGTKRSVEIVNVILRGLH